VLGRAGEGRRPRDHPRRHPGAGGTQRLTRLVGPAKAKDLVFSGRHVAAEEALALGIADRVVPDADVYETALAMARSYADGPAVALRAAKQAIDDGLELDLESALRLETALFAGCSHRGPAHRHDLVRRERPRQGAVHRR
jgi:enoyl-CoA hydratase/carnithine racemase